ncbi:MAG: cobyrinate a,c-diamide synthase [Firmicutes bacterium]|nr:cobyrinate a,c-diamide synthase [Bacillota bacterium]
MINSHQQQSMPRLVVAALASGAGKTTVTIALMHHWRQEGRRVQPFKVGPDYIDPNFHEAITGAASWNLDAWMESPEGVRRVFWERARESEVAVIEGVMGLFDGMGLGPDNNSTAHIARILTAPVLLVLDVYAVSETAAALVLGVRQYAPEMRLGGVILNRVGSPGHYARVKDAIEEAAQVPVLGYLPASPEIQVPERHLGLTRLNASQLAEWTAGLRDLAETTFDWPAIWSVAESAPPLAEPASALPRPPLSSRRRAPRVALALDDAFWFYYPANLSLLRQLGAELVPFSPLRGDPIPREATHLYWGGGFPEQYLPVLAERRRAWAQYRACIEDGLLTLAECGGWMMMAETLWNTDGEAFDLLGVAPVSMRMTAQVQAVGYREVEVLASTRAFVPGTGFRGHEFHYSRQQRVAPRPAYRLRTPQGDKEDGYATDTLVAGYAHLYFPSNVEAVAAWLGGGQGRQ